jgi:hypothetical protein
MACLLLLLYSLCSSMHDLYVSGVLSGSFRGFVVIDYQHNCVALSNFTAALSAAAFADASTTRAQQRALADVNAEGGRALLGAFVHHLLGHAASDGAEIALMQRAADLWARGATLCTQLGAIRADLEKALESPGDPGSVDRFNGAAVSVQDFANTSTAMLAEIDSLRSDVLKFPHLLPHPRQRDRKTDTWDWGNLSLGRRTDALVRNLSRRSNHPATVAFATGATSSYGGNVAGSAYLGHVVGGPRRAHRHRDRIARNAIGNWFATHPAALTPAEMADRITFGTPGNPTLPPELDTLLKTALTDTFDLGRTQPLPDLQLGYRRLVTHLRLLDAFVRPVVPTPPGQVWMAALYGDPQNPPISLRPQDIDVNGQDGGGAAVTVGSPEPGSNKPDNSDSSKTAKGCGIALLLIIVVDLVQAFVQCIGQWANNHRCTFWDNMLLSKAFEQDPPDPRDSNAPENPNVTASQLTVISNTPQAISLVGQLFDVHAQVWEAMDKAYVFLAVTGLIYPGHLVKAPLYAQFTSVPAGQPWPHREEPDPAYHLYPSSPLENPTVTPSPFAAGDHPDVSLSGNQLNPAAVSLSLWRQIAAGQHDSQNLDLDADRGSAHPCWVARGSIRDNPVDVLILGFDEQ